MLSFVFVVRDSCPTSRIVVSLRRFVDIGSARGTPDSRNRENSWSKACADIKRIHRTERIRVQRLYAEFPDTLLEGYAWGENVGGIWMGTHTAGGIHSYANITDYGVNIDGSGNRAPETRVWGGSSFTLLSTVRHTKRENHSKAPLERKVRSAV